MKYYAARFKKSRLVLEVSFLLLGQQLQGVEFWLQIENKITCSMSNFM
jgi:hypothetical protein